MIDRPGLVGFGMESALSGLEFGGEFRNSRTVDRDGSHDQGHSLPVAQRQHRFDLALHLFRTGTVGLVDDEDVGDLHNAGFNGLDVVAHAWYQHHNGHISERRYVDFVLSDAHGFNNYEIEARRAEEPRERRAGTR